jgi:hypothetical protein
MKLFSLRPLRLYGELFASAIRIINRQILFPPCYQLSRAGYFYWHINALS